MIATLVADSKHATRGGCARVAISWKTMGLQHRSHILREVLQLFCAFLVYYMHCYSTVWAMWEVCYVIFTVWAVVTTAIHVSVGTVCSSMFVHCL